MACSLKTDEKVAGLTPIEITVCYELRDWIRFQRFTIFHRRRTVAFLVVSALACGLIVLDDGVPGALFVVAFFMTFFSLGLPVIQAVAATAKSRRQPDRGAVTMRMGEDGIQMQAGGISSHMPWPTLGPRLDTRHLLLVELGGRDVYFLLPRRLLTPEQYACVGAWLRQRDSQQDHADLGVS